MTGYVIGDLDRSNHGSVRQLILDGLASHWGELNPALNRDLDDMFASYGSGRTIVVTGPNGSVVGTGTLMPRQDGVAEIVRMAVDEGHRRHGIGRLIVDELAATAHCWGSARVLVETTTAWTEVVAFYLSCGFAITHTERSQFGEDTWFERAVTDPGAFRSMPA